MRQAYDSWTPEQIKEKLKDSTVILSDDPNGRTPDNRHGWGRLNAIRALDNGPAFTWVGDPDGENGWFTGNIIRLYTQDQPDPLDVTTGPREIYWDLNDGARTGSNVTLNGLGPNETLSTKVTITNDGEHQLTAWSVDNGGNREANKTWTVKRDATSPDTDGTLTGEEGENGWYTSPVTVEFTCQDATSGCETTTYEHNAQPTQTYTDPFTISEDGTHLVTYRSTDVASNVEADEMVSVSIDQIAPTSEHTLTPQANGSRLELTAGDATSGLDEIQLRVDDGDWRTYTEPVHLEPGQTVDYRAIDIAGNVEQAHTIGVPVPEFLEPDEGTLTVRTGAGTVEHPIPEQLQGEVNGSAVTVGTVYFELAVDPVGENVTTATVTVRDAPGDLVDTFHLVYNRTLDDGRHVFAETWDPPSERALEVLIARGHVEDEEGAHAAAQVKVTTVGEPGLMDQLLGIPAAQPYDGQNAQSRG